MNVALRPDSLNLISLCTGGGGLDIGVELAIPNARPVVLVEGEAWSVATLVAAMEEHLLAPAPLWSDVRTFDGRPWRGLVDGLIGGIPCQPHSLAGKRQGEEDERDLWSPARRIIVQSRPWLVLIENVRGMLSADEGKTPGAERVWRDLQRLGYEVEFGIFTAEEVGASHERERVFILAVADRDGEHGHGGWTSRAGRRPQPTNGSLGVGHSNRAGLEGRGHQPPGRAGERSLGSDGGELADPGRERDERRRGAGIVLRTARGAQGQEGERQRRRDAPCDRGDGLVNAESIGRGERRPEPIIRSGRDTVGGTDAELVHAVSRGHDGLPPDTIGGPIGRDVAQRSGGGSFPSLSPPGPADLDSWRRVLAHSPELEPAVRRMADGVAARLDLAGPHAARIERLRMLGNGVHPLQAAYAVRALATRLARRSAGAAELVRMMEAELCNASIHSK